MDTYKCTSCKKKFSTLSKTCPECGGTLKKSISFSNDSDNIGTITEFVIDVAEVILDIVTD